MRLQNSISIQSFFIIPNFHVIRNVHIINFMIFLQFKLQFSPRPITTLIGREDARKSGRCITRFAVGKLKMRVMPVTIRTRAGAGLNCNQFKFLFSGLCAPPHGLRPIK